MMEIRQYFFLLRKWFWLLVLGGVLGGAGAFFVSMRQTEVFQASSKMLIQSPMDLLNSNYYSYYDDIQRVKNYAELLTTEPILNNLSDLLGYRVSEGIAVKQVPDSQIVAITVNNADPQKTADIANNLIDVFIAYNTKMQTDRFAESEQNLQAQIGQVETQISTLQVEMDRLSQQTLDTQKKDAAERINALESQIKPLKDEIATIQLDLEPFFIVLPTPVGNPRSSTPAPTATWTAEQAAVVKGKQDLLDEKQTALTDLESQLELYKNLFVNLTVFGEANQGDNQNYNQSQLQTNLALYQQIYSNLLNNYENVRLSRLRSTPTITRLETAKVPVSSIQPRPARSTAMGIVVGVLIMGAIAFLFEYLDDTLKTPEDVTGALGVPVIGLIGEMVTSGRKKKTNGEGVFVIEHPRSPVAEAFRALRTNLEFASVDKPLRTLLITSAEPSEGKTTIALNLAASMVHGDKKVVLMDADLRKPSTHKHLHMPNRVGLSDLFRHPEELNNVISTYDKLPIMLITSGAIPPNPAELLSSVTMDRIINDVKEISDIIIIDSPPFVVADPVVLSAKVDGVLIVIEPGGTRIEAAQAMIEQLHRSGARVVGAVLNPIIHKRAQYYSGRYRYYSEYYYSSGYGYYADDSGTGKGKKRSKKGANEPALESKVDPKVQSSGVSESQG